MEDREAGKIVLSVLLPFRDPGGLLADTLGRFEDLCRDGVEFVLVDDGSTDGSTRTAEDWVTEHDRAVLITPEKHGGVSWARDVGVRAAHGEYVWMIDCDDRVPSGTMGALLAALSARSPAHGDRAPVDMVVFRARVVEISGRTREIDGAPGRRQLRLNRSELAAAVLDGTVRGYLWTKVIRRSVLIGILDSYEHTSSQSDFMTVLACVPQLATTVLLPQVGYEYLQREGSISTTDTRQLDNTARCAERALSVLPPMVEGRIRPQILAASFRLWFHLVPCCATPVHRGRPPATVREIHRRLLPQIGLRGIVAAAVTGHVREAVHALILRILGPSGSYTPVYRTGRRLIDFVAARSAVRRRS